MKNCELNTSTLLHNFKFNRSIVYIFKLKELKIEESKGGKLEKCSSFQCKIVEVKGPGDSLSTKQKLWLQYLQRLGIRAEVCIVKGNSLKYSSTNTQKHKIPKTEINFIPLNTFQPREKMAESTEFSQHLVEKEELNPLPVILYVW